IGNYGINPDDFETSTPTIGGFAVREYNDFPSNWRSEKTLSETMKQYKIAGIYGIDTRKLVRSIRDYGSRRCLITGMKTTADDGVKTIFRTPVLTDAVSKVGRKQPEWFPADGDMKIVAIDCGMKQNIIRSFNRRGVSVTALPFDTDSESIEAANPDGLFVSNGPGDPADATPVIRTVEKLKGKLPIFGICLGHQIISLAYGAKTYKLKFGHRGGNHPVKNLETGKIEITSQNHSYAVDESSLNNTPLSVTHVNLLDGTVEGVQCLKDRLFSVQYHPESAPGPEDSDYLFDKFIRMMRENKHA
ncbi:MAG: carbamoyl phosphate synthase small subunit, partial [Bacillota bacterium]